MTPDEILQLKVTEEAQRWLDSLWVRLRMDIDMPMMTRWPGTVIESPPAEVPFDEGRCVAVICGWEIGAGSKVIRLFQHRYSYEEESGCCHCGTAMNDHTESDNHGAVDASYEHEVTYLVRDDTDDVVAVDCNELPPVNDIDGSFCPSCFRNTCLRHKHLVSAIDLLLAALRKSGQRIDMDMVNSLRRGDLTLTNIVHDSIVYEIPIPKT